MRNIELPLVEHNIIKISYAVVNYDRFKLAPTEIMIYHLLIFFQRKKRNCHEQ